MQVERRGPLGRFGSFDRGDDFAGLAAAASRPETSVDLRTMKAFARLTVVSLAALAGTCTSARAPTPTPTAAPGGSAPPAGAPIGAPAWVELSDEHAHNYLLENQYVYMVNLVLEPNAATRVHRHRHDFVAVATGGGQVSDEIAGKAPVVLKLKDGQVRFVESGLGHAVRSLGSATFREVIIELKRDDPAHKAAAPTWEEASGVKTAGGARREILFVRDGVRVSTLLLAPGSVEPQRVHSAAEVLVAVSDLDVGKGDASAKLKAGEVQWRGGRYTGTLSNNGKQPAKMVLLEFK